MWHMFRKLDRVHYFLHIKLVTFRAQALSWIEKLKKTKYLSAFDC